MSKANQLRAYCLSKVGLPYQLGEEFDHNVGPTLTPEEDGDCSGIFYAGCREVGVLVDGRPLNRRTADGYYRLATRIATPRLVLDCCWFPRLGRKTHMAVYIGYGQVIEAGYHGPGGVYPGHGYVGLCTVQQMDARGAVWGRIKTDIGRLEGDTMEALTNEQASEELCRIRASTIAQSNDQEVDLAVGAAIVAAVRGDQAQADAKLLEAKMLADQAQQAALSYLARRGV